MRNINKVMYGIGFFFIIGSIIRWGFYYEDLFRLCIWSAIGIIICGFAYIYNWMNIKDLEDINFRKQYDSLVTELHSRGIVKLGIDVE